jgi:hypothetical protein
MISPNPESQGIDRNIDYNSIAMKKIVVVMQLIVTTGLQGLSPYIDNLRNILSELVLPYAH